MLGFTRISIWELGIFALSGDISEKGNLLQGTTTNVFLKVCLFLFILFNSDYNEQHCELFNIWPYLSCSTDLWGKNGFFALYGPQELKKCMQNILL